MSELAAGVTIVELANDPAFERTFIAALAFPVPLRGEPPSIASNQDRLFSNP
jgi:hypothetical protein